MKRFPGKVALITGAASGIGAATARRLVDEGATVMLGDVNGPKGIELAIEHAREGIRVNAVCPGPIDTPLTSRLRANPVVADGYRRFIPIGRTGTADEVADAIVFLASDEARYITGVMLPVDGGLTAASGQPDYTKAFSGKAFCGEC